MKGSALTRCRAERAELDVSLRSANLPWPSMAGAFSTPTCKSSPIPWGFFGHVAFFGQPPKCEVAHISLPFSPSKVRHGDIYLAPGGDTWHQNQNELVARFNQFERI